MIAEIYHNYANSSKLKIMNEIDSYTNINIRGLEDLFKLYKKKYYNFDMNNMIKNTIIEYGYNKLKELDIVEDEIDSIIPGQNKDIITLPSIDRPKIKKTIIKLDSVEDNFDVINGEDSICYHNIKWINIKKLPSDQMNQAIFDFVNQYLKIDDRNEYICKSCGEGLAINKYVGDVIYNKESEIATTVSFRVTIELDKVAKYSKYVKIIKILDKMITRISSILSLSIYLGNTITTIFLRKSIIKDVLDLILVHTEWLKKQPKTRIEDYTKEYNTNLTNLFFFELKDDIFLKSSTDTDYYKNIKYNNVLAYILLIMILELNAGQILAFKVDKRYNYFLYNKVDSGLFTNLYIRLNQKDKILISKIPLLCYIIYFFSGLFYSSKMWLGEEKNTQRNIIHTLLDLINSVVEANFEDKKDYFYEMINTRLTIKIKHLFNDLMILESIKLLSDKSVKYDDDTKKLTFTTKKVNFINLDVEEKYIVISKERCNLSTSFIETIPIKAENNNIDNITNCSNGYFHNWLYKNNNLVCTKCNQNYNDILKLNKKNNHLEILEKVKFLHLKKLTNKYCLSGNTHEIKETTCSKCKIDPTTYKYSNKELETLDKNLEEKIYEKTLDNINKFKSYLEKDKEMKLREDMILKKFLILFSSDINNKIDTYIEKFVDRLVLLLGPKIKIKNKSILIKDSIYTIDHDYMGNPEKNNITILKSENKMHVIKHNIFNKEILYYKDKAKNIYVYYDIISYQYLGYSEDNKTLKKTKNIASLKFEPSIYDSLLLLGYKNMYLNLYHINSSFQDNLPSKIDKDTIIHIIRERANNLKQCITRAQSIIYNIKYKGDASDGKDIIEEFSKKLDNITLKKDKLTIFKHIDFIKNKLPLETHNTNIDININTNYIDIISINSLNNLDIKLLYYLIFNFNRLLDLNKQTDNAYLIVRIIQYIFNQYYLSYSDYQIRLFDIVSLKYNPNMYYGNGYSFHEEAHPEPPSVEENEKKYDANEEASSLDVDDYDDPYENEEGNEMTDAPEAFGE
jgi:hypothetical protein